MSVTPLDSSHLAALPRVTPVEALVGSGHRRASIGGRSTGRGPRGIRRRPRSFARGARRSSDDAVTPSPAPKKAPPVVYRWFTDPAARAIYPPDEHPHHCRVFVADLHAVAARRGRDTEAARMVAVLRRRSEEFATLWDTHDVALRRVDHKRIVHPALGVIELDCHSLFSEDGRQRLLWFTAPPGTQGAAQLELLSVIGTQDMAASESALREGAGVHASREGAGVNADLSE
nr:hypothetical protein [Streptomyces sp. V1I1]